MQRLLNREGKGLELEPGVAVYDIELDATDFADDLALLEDLNENVPALRIADEKVPISLSFVIRRSDGGPLLPFGY